MVTTTRSKRPSDPFLDIRCEEGRTDVANAKRFATLYGETMFYVHALKAWHYWDHRRWKRDEDGEAGRRASRVVEIIWKAARELADGNTKREAIQWAGVSAGGSRINAMLKLAQDQLPMPLENLNRDPFLLNCRNCTICAPANRALSGPKITSRIFARYPSTTNPHRCSRSSFRTSSAAGMT